MHDDARRSPAVPPEPGTLPTEANPDPAPERDELMPTDAGEQDPLGQPVGRDNIREWSVTSALHHVRRLLQRVPSRA